MARGFRACSRPPGLESSLNKVHVRIYHNLKVMSYLTRPHHPPFFPLWQAFVEGRQIRTKVFSSSASPHPTGKVRGSEAFAGCATLDTASVFSVARFEHRSEPGDFHLASFAGAGFFEAATNAELLQRLFAVEFLFQPANGFFDRLAFFQSYFGHAKGDVKAVCEQKIYKLWDSCLFICGAGGTKKERIHGNERSPSINCNEGGLVLK